MNDTPAGVAALLIEGYRNMSPADKIARVRALTRSVHELALADIRRRYPSADVREQSLRLASRWIAPAVMVRAFGWNPEREGY